MTIDEAILLLQRDIDNPGSVYIEDLNTAGQLGIEALRQIKQIRAYAKELYLPLLPGETTD